MRTESGGIHLAHSLDAACGLELQENEVAAAVARRRIAHYENLDAVEFHIVPFPKGS